CSAPAAGPAPPCGGRHSRPSAARPRPPVVPARSPRPPLPSPCLPLTSIPAASKHVSERPLGCILEDQARVRHDPDTSVPVPTLTSPASRASGDTDAEEARASTGTPEEHHFMYRTKAYSAAGATTPLAATTIPRRDPTPRDAQIEILFCGICHSDLHAVRNE